MGSAGVTAQTYTAIAAGKVSLTFDTLKCNYTGDGAKLSDFCMVIVKNNQVIWPQAAAGKTLNTAAIYTADAADAKGIQNNVNTEWFYAKLGTDAPIQGDYLPQLAAYCTENSDPLPTGIDVQPGDQLHIVYKRVNTPHISAHPVVTYTEVTPETALWSGITTSLACMYKSTISGSINTPTVSDGGTTAGTRATFHGNWDYVSYSTDADFENGNVELINTVVEPGMLGTATRGGNAWYNSPTGMFHLNQNNPAQWGDCTIIPVKTSGAGVRYTAEYTGLVKLDLTSLRTVLTTPYGAIFINGEMVWPTAGGDYADRGDWYKLEEKAVEYATTAESYAAKGVVLGEKTFYLNAGDTVEVLFKLRADDVSFWENNKTGIWAYLDVAYSELYPDVENEVSVTLASSFALNVFITVDAAFTDVKVISNATEYPATRQPNGAYKATLPGKAAKNLTDKIAYAVTATLHEQTVTLGWHETTIAAVLQGYVGGANSGASDLAIATLNYAAAAQNYFDYKTDDLANKGLSDGQKAVTHGTYEKALDIDPLAGATVALKGMTLLLNDTVNFKLTVNTTDITGLKAQISADNGANWVDALRLEACDGGNGDYKAIFAGITPGAWNTDYQMRVVNGAGEPVSSTVTYSVSTYAVRMAGNAEVKSVTDAMLALYEKAAAYVAG